MATSAATGSLPEDDFWRRLAQIDDFLCRRRRPVNGEDDFARAEVIDVQVQLRAEFARFPDLQFTGNLTGTWRKLAKIGALRTEAAINASALDNTEDAQRLGRTILVPKEDFAFLARPAAGNF